MNDLKKTAPLTHENPAFFGRFGFRAGWGIVIFLVVAAVLTFVASTSGIAATGQLAKVREAQAHPNGQSLQSLVPFVPIYVILSDGIIFFGLLAFCWLMSRAERRPLASYGIGKKRRTDVFPGAIWGLVSMSALVTVLHSLHFLIFDGRALYGSAILLWGTKWFLAFLLVGFCEEYEFRGYLQYTLMRGVWGLAERTSPSKPQAAAFWIAATIMSLTFGGLHLLNGGENLFGISQVVLIGLAFSYALWRTGSLWWGIGFHAVWDWAQSFLFGVADSGSVSPGRLFITHPAGKTMLSGGSDGPEGSIFAAVAVLLTFLIIRFTTRPGVQPSPEQMPLSATLPPEHSVVIP